MTTTLRIRTRSISAALSLLLLPFVFGCSFTTTPSSVSNGNRSRPEAMTERANAAEIWLALAHAVEAKTIDTTSRLTQYVVVLARNGDLSAADVSAFDAAFPQAAKNDRSLTAADAKQLRMLK